MTVTAAIAGGALGAATTAGVARLAQKHGLFMDTGLSAGVSELANKAKKDGPQGGSCAV